MLTLFENYGEADFAGLIRVQQESFPPPFPSELWWNEQQLSNHVRLFPAGAICAKVDGEVVGSVTGLVMNWTPGDASHTWAEVTDSGYIRTHDANGNTLYIVDISVRPAFRKLGIGKALMHCMYDVVSHLGLARVLGGARMPRYHEHAATMTPEQYLESIVAGEIQDPIVTFLMRCGRVPVRVVHDYLDDEESANCAVLMEWRNPFRNQV